MQGPVTTYRCGALRDAAGTSLRPGVVAVCDGRILAVGEPGKVKGDTTVDLTDRLVMPGMVNAHAHLGLTALGRQPYGGDFMGWIRQVRVAAPADGTASLREGERLSREAGVFAVGDIVADTGSSGLAGVQFVEMFGLGAPWDESGLRRIEALAEENPRIAIRGLRVGLQPHAPYSAGPAIYAAAAASDLPVCTHLAETPEEMQFVAEAAGPMRDFLIEIGKWDDAFAAMYGEGLSPVQWMLPYLRRRPWLLAHCNYVSDEDIALLAAMGASVAYCPIASEYFGHRGHRYRHMLEAGVNVCLGTDSIVCQPGYEPPEVSQPLGIFDQMRRLYQRDGTDLDMLLAMATTRGCDALGMPRVDATLAAGSPARLVGVRFDPADPADPLTQVMRSRYPVEPLTGHSLRSE